MRCDIILPIWNQLVFTRDCIDSIVKNTIAPYRLILIDNASGDETRRYLEGLQERLGPRVLLVRNDENVGFVKAVNQGLRLSDAQYACILNNDTLVTSGWLDEMIAVAERAGDIGIVNPSSNNLGQKPANGEPFEQYAEGLRKEAGIFTELGSAIGFCMLIKRQVIEKIGLFDEIYGMGNFEDTDFSRRAVKEGYRCVRAHAAYVYHQEHGSFDKRKSFEDDFNRNREIYEFRWGKPRRIAYILDVYGETLLRRLRQDSLKLAREGNWIWYFSRNPVTLPEHSNIVSVVIPEKYFYPKTIFTILKKKKRFDEIFVAEERIGKILEGLAFLHKARVQYY